MNEHRTFPNSDTPLTQPRSPAVQAELTRLRGMVRRLPQGVRKQRLELLAPQIQDGSPTIYLERQSALTAGQPLPVRPLADSAVRALAVIAEARQRFAVG